MIDLLILLLFSGAAPEAAIHVDASRREATPVPRGFFSQFGEHIGRNVYGGQWAQILGNPSFEGYEFFGPDLGRANAWDGIPGIADGRDVGLACYWLPEGEAEFAMDDENPFNSKSSQRVKVSERGGVRQPVRLPLHRVRKYAFSFYARATEPTTARVRLQSREGEPFCTAEAPVAGGGWKPYAVKLEVPEGPEAGRVYDLALVFDGPTTVWIDHAELFPADHINGHDPDVVRLMKDLDVSLLRFPGGNFASGYHWRDGVGPREKRVMMHNPAWKGAEYNHVGTHEWMAFAEAIGAEPFICVNCGDGTPVEAAEWVRYCNEPADAPLGKLRAANGHPAPFAVRLWEVGNELWGDWQIGHCTPEEYAQRYDAFSKAMLDANPNLRLIANGGPDDWNERFLKAVTEPVRSLSVHRLIGWGVPPEAAPEDVAMALAAYGLHFDGQLDEMRDLFRATGHPDAKVALTEVMSVARRAGAPRTCSRHAESLYFAGVMNACIRHRDLVEIITRTAVINHGGGRAKVFEVAFPEPVHYLSMLYGTMSGRWPVACAVDAPTYDVALSGLPRAENVPVLEGIALLDDAGAELTLLVTNRDPVNAQAAKIKVAGFDPAPQARSRTIAAPPDAVNVWNEPPRVKIVEGRVEAGTAFDYAFPACSITELVFKGP